MDAADTWEVGALLDSKTQSLIDPTFLFRFEVPIQQDSCEFGPKGLKLPETCRLPAFGVVRAGDRGARDGPWQTPIAMVS